MSLACLAAVSVQFFVDKGVSMVQEFQFVEAGAD